MFQPFVWKVVDKVIVLEDASFHAKDGNRPNLKICEREMWNVGLLVESVLAMLTTICYFEKMVYRIGEYLQARLTVWLPSIFLFDGLAFSPMKMGSFIYLSPNSVFD